MIHVEENVDLHSFTTFRVGGKTRFFFRATSEQDLLDGFKWANQNNEPVFVLGGGSNVLFSDRGWEGLVIKMECVDMREVAPGQLSVGASASLHALLEYAKEHGLSGLERLAGIPGTVGGAVRGNAGAFGAETAQAVASVRILDRRTLTFEHRERAACEFRYRSSLFKQHPEYVVVSAHFLLQPGADPAVLERIMRETIATREQKHPQRLLCAGSFFMNPPVKDARLREEFEKETGMVVKDEKLPAGWLIDYVGLRGKQIGGARVSDIHPNYLLNVGTATAENILILASVVKQKVRSELGIILREEVQMVGF
ncbi:MAG: UDP-N-acetylmuramate dehydrogenase [Candidatus Moraniibacteriota bacterium]|nr:MAG: UDP-N-acetylmuramate dehydrogenase [Candidatus Moranbacteria bacterium]